MTVIEPVRVGVDIDGVMASKDWASPPWHARNGWERRPVLDAEGHAELAHRARSDVWEVYAITARPPGPGSTTRQQTRRWLERHDAVELSVVVECGRRRDLVRVLNLDWLVDDTLDNCIAAQTGDVGGGHLDRRAPDAQGARDGGVRRPRGGRTPLGWCVSTLGGDAARRETTGPKMLDLLLAFGADPNAACGQPGGHRPSVLVAALEAGSAWAIKALVDNGADIEEARNHVRKHGLRCARDNATHVVEALRLIV